MSLTWYHSKKRFNQILVRKPPVGLATYDVALEVGGKADAILEAHRHKGHAKIEVARGSRKVDAFVTLDDSRGDAAALSIEYGHFNKQSKKFVRGPGPLSGAVAQIV